MLQLTIKPHRTYLRANAGQQKLFVMLKMLPSPEAARARPEVNLAIVMDTSGSMREPAPGANVEIVPSEPVVMDGKTYTATFEGSTKLDVAMEAARRLVDSQNLQPDDMVTLIQFEDESRVVAKGRPGQDRTALAEGIDSLSQYSGGTQMARGSAMPWMCSARRTMRRARSFC